MSVDTCTENLFLMGAGDGIAAVQQVKENSHSSHPWFASKYHYHIERQCRPGALLSGGRQVGAGLQFQVLEVARRRRSSVASALTVVQVESAVR